LGEGESVNDSDRCEGVARQFLGVLNRQGDQLDALEELARSFVSTGVSAPGVIQSLEMVRSENSLSDEEADMILNVLDYFYGWCAPGKKIE
jgi:Ca2+-binding EF-hand superfamily protein